MTEDVIVYASWLSPDQSMRMGILSQDFIRGREHLSGVKDIAVIGWSINGEAKSCVIHIDPREVQSDCSPTGAYAYFYDICRAAGFQPTGCDLCGEEELCTGKLALANVVVSQQPDQ